LCPVALRPCSPVASCAQPWLFIRTLAYREGVQTLACQLVPFGPVALASAYATARAHRNHYLDKGSKGWPTQQPGFA